MKRTIVVLGLLLLALPASADTGQELWVTFYCVTNQSGITLPMYSVEGRPGAEFTVNGEAVGTVLNGGYGVNGENTWTATPLPGFELTSPTTGAVTLDCGTGFETAGGGYDCERKPWKCQDTTTTTTTTPTTIPETTTSTQSSTTTTVTVPDSTTTTVSSTDTTTSTTIPATSTVASSESTTTTSLIAISSTDPSVTPADIELPNTGLSHDVWAALVFAAFVLMVVGGMAVLAGRDDDE